MLQENWEKITLFSGPKRQPAECIIIINDIQTEIKAGKSFVEHSQNK